jgi:hypothetical protein
MKISKVHALHSMNWRFCFLAKLRYPSYVSIFGTCVSWAELSILQSKSFVVVRTNLNQDAVYDRVHMLLERRLYA